MCFCGISPQTADNSKHFKTLKPAMQFLQTNHLSMEEQLRLSLILANVRSCRYLRQQVIRVVDCLLPLDWSVSSTWDSIGKIFGLTKGSVRDLYKKVVFSSTWDSIGKTVAIKSRNVE